MMLTLHDLLHLEGVGVVGGAGVRALQPFGIPLKARLPHQLLHCIAAFVSSKQLGLPHTRSVSNVVSNVLG